ncbi:MAG: right-handed parallel beta-helix repeat-containing protein [Thermoplasmata archaeon]
MKLRKIPLLVFVILFIFSSVSMFSHSLQNAKDMGPEQLLDTSISKEPGSITQHPSPSSDYHVRSPIRINNNTEFDQMAEEEDWAGSGSESDPYVIEGYYIDATGFNCSIFIGNTDVHFVVRDCYVANADGNWGKYGMNTGITLYNVTNGRLENNVATNNWSGIEIEKSEGNVITNNNASNNDYTSGIIIDRSDNNTVEGNTASFNKGYGLLLISSNDNDIIDNTASENSGRGIKLDESHRNTISRNLLSSHEYDGLNLFVSDNNLITNNTLLSNSQWGIRLGWCLDNRVYHNNFINNHYSAYDNRTDIWNASYPIGGNYWSGYPCSDSRSGPGQNLSGSDGIGDWNYSIGGGSNVDEYPLVHPYGSPFVLSTSPHTNGCNVTSGVNITVLFSESLNGSIQPVLEETTDSGAGYTYMGIYSTYLDNDTAIWNTTSWPSDTSITLNIFNFTDMEGIQGDDHSWSFMTEDTTPPVSSVDDVSPYWKETSSIQLTPTFTESNSGFRNATLSYRYSSNNRSWSDWKVFENDTSLSCGWTFDFPNGEGYYEFYSRATDKANNKEEYKNTAEAACGYDITPPNIADLTDDAPTTGDNFSFRVNVTDKLSIQDVSITYRYDSTESFNESMTKSGDDWTYEIQTIPNDAKTLHYNFHARDESSNWESTGNHTLNVMDNDIPSITDNSPNTGTTGDPFVFDLTVTDNINVSVVYLQYTFWENSTQIWNITMDNPQEDIWSHNITLQENSTRNLHYTITSKDTSNNWVSSTTKEVMITDNDGPTAKAGDDVTIIEGGSVSFDGSDSYDNIGIESYTWSCAEIPDFDLSLVKPDYIFDSPGTYNITLTVEDSAGNIDTDTLVVEVLGEMNNDTDNDGDGMDDKWEIENGLNPRDPSDVEKDPDDDGLTNLQEYEEGTDPNDPDTDGDGLLDGEDDDPLTAGEEEKNVWFILAISLVIIVIGAVVMAFYLIKIKKSEPVEKEFEMEEDIENGDHEPDTDEELI